jgi:hypothetical protein
VAQYEFHAFNRQPGFIINALTGKHAVLRQHGNRDRSPNVRIVQDHFRDQRRRLPKEGTVRRNKAGGAIEVKQLVRTCLIHSHGKLPALIRHRARDNHVGFIRIEVGREGAHSDTANRFSTVIGYLP